MAFFDFVENFFFISLGITFGLILLLVYHFKQRISSVERRGDTMFELLTNVVKELQIMKSLNSYYESIFHKSTIDTPESKSTPEIDVCMFRPPEQTEKKVIDLPISKPADMFVSKIAVSDDSDSDSDSDSELLSELSDNEDGSDSDDESAEPEPEPEPEKTEFDLGVENVLSETIDVVCESVEALPEPIELLSAPLEESYPEPEPEPKPVEDPEPTTEFAEPTREQKREIYRKMNITQLRGMATAAGIAGDLAKLKKAEIIKLLENLDE